MSKRSKWLATAAVSFLCLTGLSAVNANAADVEWWMDGLAGNEDSAGQDIRVYGHDNVIDLAITNVTQTIPMTRPMFGDIVNTFDVIKDGIATDWGTHFIYVPDPDWYGTDWFNVLYQSGDFGSGDVRFYETAVTIKVANVPDAPWITGDSIFLLNCDASETCGGTNAAVTLQAGDVDNWPTNAAATYGLTYAFDDGSVSKTTVNPTDGYATLTVDANNLPIFSFFVTDVTASIDEDFLVVVTDLDGLKATNTVSVYFTDKSAPILTDSSAVKFHPEGEAWNDCGFNKATVRPDDPNCGIFEGEALKFSASWADYWTNNPASYPMPLPCMFGIKSVVWNVYDQTSPSPNTGVLLQTQVFEQDPLLTNTDEDGDGTNDTSKVTDAFVFDTSSDRWFVDPRTPFPHTYVAEVECLAIDVCNNTNRISWFVVVKPTLEYPVITFPKQDDITLGESRTLTASEHNGNPIGWEWYPIDAGAAIDLDPVTGQFTALTNGMVAVRAVVYGDNQNLAGAVTRSFNILVPADYLPKTKVVVITGNDTNESCYGEVIVSAPTPGPWAIGTPISFFAQQTQLGVDNGGFTFLRWAIPETWDWYNAGCYHNLWDWTLHFNPYTRPIRSGVGVGDLGLGLQLVNGHIPEDQVLSLMAIFKKTSELAVPVVNDPLGEMTDALPCLKINEDMGTFTFNASATVQSEDFPGIEAVGLPAGLSFTADFARDDDPSPSAQLNNHFFNNFMLFGTPTEVVVPGRVVTLYATNGFWQAGHRDKLGRDIVGRFTIEVKPQEAPVPTDPYPPIPFMLRDGKETKPYDCPMCNTMPMPMDMDMGVEMGMPCMEPCCCTPMPDAAVCSDTPVWLKLYVKDGDQYDDLPAGLKFSVESTVLVEAGACGCYLDSYAFSGLKISGTPELGTAGDYTLALVAVNEVGETEIGELMFTVNPVTAPVIERAPEFVDQEAHIDWPFEYVAGICDTPVCQELLVWSDAEGLGIDALNLPPGLKFILTDVAAYDVWDGDCYQATEALFTCLKIYGTPTASGPFDVSIVATNVIGSTTIATFRIDVKGKTAPEFVTEPWFTQPLSVGRVGRAYDYSFAGDLTIFSNDGAPTLTVTGLPAGLTFNFAGLEVEDAAFGKNYIYSGLQIVGIPAVSGTFTVTFSAENGSGTSVMTFLLTIKPHAAPLAAMIETPVLCDAKITKPYEFDFPPPPHHPIVVTSDIPVVLQVAGLPAGLTFTYDVSKQVGDATTDNLDAYTFTNLKIAGVPTVAGDYPLTLKAVNGINPDALIATFGMKVQGATVNPTPTSLTQSGTFDGWAASGWRKGVASMSIKKGAGDRFTLSGKFMLADQGYTFKADQRALTQTVDGEFLLNTYIMVKAARVNITLQVLGDRVTVVALDSVPELSSGLNVEMFRNNWATWDDDMPNGYYTVALPSLDGVAGSGYLALTVNANGTIKAAGKLADGTARSFSSVLLTVDGRFFAVLHTAPVTYRGGYFFGVVEFVYDYDQGKWIVELFETSEETLANMALSLSEGCSDYAVYPPEIVMPAECVLWVNNDPKATANYNDASDYDQFTDYKDGINHGFVRALDVVGGQYSDTVSLQTYYVGNVPDVADLLYTFRGASCSTCAEERSAQASSWNPGGLMITGWTAPKADTPKKTDASLVWPEQPNFDFYTYGDSNGDGVDNSLGLKISFTKATGLFRGTFNVYYDYITSENETTGKVTTKHTAVKVTYQGVALPARADLTDGYDGRGYFLMPAQSSYMDVAGKECKYKFNWSYDFSLTKAYDERPTDY